MAGAINLPREISLLRICAQGLAPAADSADVVGVVERLCAVQGQQVSALPHALIARARCAMRSDVV
ncbi:MAG: hypothetical protein Q4B10_07120 [Actinomycetaceae bacterium]|nr:hypothetical protein [Actinomycetaceae bacterium]